MGSLHCTYAKHLTVIALNCRIWMLSQLLRDVCHTSMYVAHLAFAIHMISALCLKNLLSFQKSKCGLEFKGWNFVEGCKVPEIQKEQTGLSWDPYAQVQYNWYLANTCKYNKVAVNATTHEKGILAWVRPICIRIVLWRVGTAKRGTGGSQLMHVINIVVLYASCTYIPACMSLLLRVYGSYQGCQVDESGCLHNHPNHRLGSKQNHTLVHLTEFINPINGRFPTFTGILSTSSTDALVCPNIFVHVNI